MLSFFNWRFSTYIRYGWEAIVWRNDEREIRIGRGSRPPRDVEEGPGRVRNFGGVDGLEKPPKLSVVLGVVRDLGRAVQQPVEDFVPWKARHDDLEKMGSQGFESCHEN